MEKQNGTCSVVRLVNIDSKHVSDSKYEHLFSITDLKKTSINLELLASRLKELLEDPGKRYKMGERGRASLVEHLSLDSLAIRHEEFYTKVLNRSSLEHV